VERALIQKNIRATREFIIACNDNDER